MGLTVTIPSGTAAHDAVLRAEAARSTMSRLLTVAGHDLKQPLQIALMAIERAVLDGVGPRAAARLGLASDALQRLGRALDDLARSSQADGTPPQLRTVPLGPLLATVVSESQPYAEAVGVELRVHATDLRVYSEEAMLETILRNLVGNAVKYAGRGGRVLVGCRRVRGMITIEVHDNGPGIAPERLTGIFQAFDRGGRRDGAGLGLGLHIVRQTAQGLGHPVEVRSRYGHGSVFSVIARCVDHRRISDEEC
ncbi:histidine kinase [Methylobacterium sp. Leaf86]|uniref:sensor histidine kinase n=1 Tax=Methylobacterium sp. Leaf86 TaxID=1736242 RepID=UPI0006FF77CF|nr:HAMP domain-containing sensor histidine kinase [Methylobacterium sp. Leaf86]KQO58993.1 histidine kinase [Methylobacterium sp. Leaf86]